MLQGTADTPQKRTQILYQNVECLIETPDALLLTYGGTVTILQKKDLKTGSIEEFLTEITPQIASFVEQAE